MRTIETARRISEEPRSFTLARRSNGSLIWWTEEPDQPHVPPLLPGSSYVDIAAGYGHRLARRSDGTLVAWGANWSGQCNVPALPPGLTYVQAAVGQKHSLALLSDGTVLGWGNNAYAQCFPPPLPPDTITVVVAPSEAARAVQTRKDLARMKKAVREISLQRVYMRNEMFKEPLTNAEIKSCLAGQTLRARIGRRNYSASA